MIHLCNGEDHRLDSYSERDRRLLALVESFNRRLIAASQSGADISRVLAALDPDPARYTWVDEGGGAVEDVLDEAEAELASTPLLPGFRLLASLSLPTRLPSARPAIALGPDSSMVAAWIEWEEHVGERVLALTLDSSGQPVTDPQVVSGEPGDCLRPSVIFDGDGVPWVFFGQRRDRGVGVFYSRLSGSSWTAAAPLSTTPHPSFNQEVACHQDGSIECCWQGYRDGRFGIYSARSGRDGFSAVELLSSDSERNVWDPAIVAGDGGESLYAWTTYGARGYETALLHTSPGRPPVRQTIGAPGAYSLHPSLARGPGGSLWCAYDAVALGGHGGSGPTGLRALEEIELPRKTGTRPDGRAVPGDLAPDVRAEVVVLRLDEIGATAEPTGTVGTGSLVSPAGLPRLVRASGDSMAVAYRCLRRLPLMLYFWDTVVEFHSGSGWGSFTTFDNPDGPLEEPAVAAHRDGVVVSWQEDGRRERELAWTEGFGGEECIRLREHYGEVVWHSLHSGGRIRIAEVASPSDRPADAPQHPPVLETEAPGTRARTGQVPGSGFEALLDARAWARARKTLGSERHTAGDGDRSYSLYWGDLHRHSLISRCTAGDEPELDDFYRYSFDVCEYDFWAVTDHAENTSPYQWWSIQKLADTLYVDGRFVPFYGFEWTAATGHQNVIFESTRRGAPIYSSTSEGTRTPDQLWARLRSAGQASLTIPHHPGSAMVPFDWSYQGDDLMRLVEVFQACRGNYEDDGCFRQYSDGTLTGTFVADGLRAGHRFGLIASSDHGNGASYVGAYAEELSRESVFAALRARRTIAATTRDIAVDFRLNGCFMGGEAAPASLARLTVQASAYRDIARLDVICNGVIAHSLEPELAVGDGEVAVPVRVEWTTGKTPLTDWTGYLEVDGGEIVLTKFWSPEIVEVSKHRIGWSAHTRNFRSQYGAQRGGVELTLVGRPAAQVRISTAALSGATTLGELAALGAVGLSESDEGTLRLQRATGALRSLGTDRLTTSFEDVVKAPAWYYARVTLEDGEMAWSSPIWVTPA